jgi:hypothetical protein
LKTGLQSKNAGFIGAAQSDRLFKEPAGQQVQRAIGHAPAGRSAPWIEAGSSFISKICMAVCVAVIVILQLPEKTRPFAP